MLCHAVAAISFVPEQGSFLVRAGYRNPKLLVPIEAQRSQGKIFEDGFDFVIINGFSMDGGRICSCHREIGVFIRNKL